MTDREISQVEEIGGAMLRQWMLAPTEQPLVFTKVDEGFMATRGVPATRMTIGEAAAFFGVSRPTFKRRFLDTHKLRVMPDGRIPRSAVLRLNNLLSCRAG